MIKQSIYTNPLHPKFDENIYWLSIKINGLRACDDDDSKIELKKSLRQRKALYVKKTLEEPKFES